MATGSAPRPAIPRDVKVISAVGFIVSLGFGIVGPAIPLLARDFGVGHAAAGLVIAVTALFRLFSSFGNGALSDRFGHTRLMVIGLLLQGLTTIGAGLAPTFPLLLGFRALGGIASAAFSVAAMALILATAPPAIRGRCVAYFQSAFILGAIAGPGLGGFLTEISPRVPFFVYGFMLVLSVAPTVIEFLRKRAPRGISANPVEAENIDNGGVGILPRNYDEPELRAPAVRVRALFRSRAFLACLIVNFSVGFLFIGVRNSLLPIYVVEGLAGTPAQAGVAFSIGAVAQGLVLLRAGSVLDTWGRRPALILGGAVTISAVIVMSLIPSFVAFVVAMSMLGAGVALLASAPAAVLADLVSGRGGRPVSILQMSSDLGGVTGPVLIGALADTTTFSVALAVCVLPFVFGLVASLAMPETLDKRANPS